MINFHIITLFPDTIKPYLDASVIGRAQRNKLISVNYYSPRDFTQDKHKRVDSEPYGGGPGMVLEAESILKAIRKAVGKKRNVEFIFFTPSGKQFDNTFARSVAKDYKKTKHIVLISGRYEGIDARVIKILKPKLVSVGPFILSGGEIPAMIFVDAVARQIPGVLGKINSIEENRTASSEVYTRPATMIWRGKKYSVPKVLLSGDHKKIEDWKKKH